MRRILVLLVASATLAGCGGGDGNQQTTTVAADLPSRLDAHTTRLGAFLDEGPALGREQLSERAGTLATEAKGLADAVEDAAAAGPAARAGEASPASAGPARRLARALRAQHAALFRVATAGPSFGQRAFRPYVGRLRAQARRAASARAAFAAALTRDRTETTARTGGATD